MTVRHLTAALLIPLVLFGCGRSASAGNLHGAGNPSAPADLLVDFHEGFLAANGQRQHGSVAVGGSGGGNLNLGSLGNGCNKPEAVLAVIVVVVVVVVVAVAVKATADAIADASLDTNCLLTIDGPDGTVQGNVVMPGENRLWFGPELRQSLASGRSTLSLSANGKWKLDWAIPRIALAEPGLPHRLAFTRDGRVLLDGVEISGAPPAKQTIPMRLSD
ncbi:hypothetical protein LBMAG53_36720 [Planctomycetota bacterium]|nr:hypothetical protein LBMAG53_36720 [Planctomycetota bacterium]